MGTLSMRDCRRVRGEAQQHRKRDMVRQYGRSCLYCARILRDDELTIDHFHPTSRGGEDTIENRVPACPKCNAEKSNLFPLQWVISRLEYRP